MMFIHHCWGFPEDVIMEHAPVLEAFAFWANVPASFCVVIFCFITGYIYYFSPRKTYRASLSRIIKLLVPYCVVFVILISCSIYLLEYHYSLANIIDDVLTNRTVSNAWYVHFFIVLMLTLPLFAKFRPRSTVVKILVSCILVPVLIKTLSRFIGIYYFRSLLENYACSAPTAFLGYIMAENRFMEKADIFFSKNIPNRARRLTLFTLLTIVIPIENYIKTIVIEDRPLLTYVFIPTLDMFISLILVPVYLFCLVYICKAVTPLLFGKPFIYIGKESTFMWFLHSAFFNYERVIFQPILFFPHFPSLITIWGLILCYFPARGLRALLDLVSSKISLIRESK